MSRLTSGSWHRNVDYSITFVQTDITIVQISIICTDIHGPQWMHPIDISNHLQWVLVHEEKTTLKHVNVILSSLLKSRPKSEYCSFKMSVHLTLILSVVCLEIKYALNPGILSSVFPGYVLNPETTINSCCLETRATVPHLSF